MPLLTTTVARVVGVVAPPSPATATTATAASTLAAAAVVATFGSCRKQAEERVQGDHRRGSGVRGVGQQRGGGSHRGNHRRRAGRRRDRRRRRGGWRGSREGGVVLGVHRRGRQRVGLARAEGSRLRDADVGRDPPVGKAIRVRVDRLRGGDGSSWSISKNLLLCTSIGSEPWRSAFSRERATVAAAGSANTSRKRRVDSACDWGA